MELLIVKVVTDIWVETWSPGIHVNVQRIAVPNEYNVFNTHTQLTTGMLVSAQGFAALLGVM